MTLLPRTYACLAVILLAVAIMCRGSEARSTLYMAEPAQQIRAPRSLLADEPEAPKELQSLLRPRREVSPTIYETEDVPEQIRARRQMPDMPPPPMPDNMPMPPPGGK